MALTSREEKFLLALISNPTVEQACKSVGVSKQTAYNYMSKSEFKEARQKAMRGILSTVTARLQFEALQSVNVLSQIRDNEDVTPYTRVEASKILLEMAYKSYELEDLAVRMEKIEELLKEKG